MNKWTWNVIWILIILIGLLILLSCGRHSGHSSNNSTSPNDYQANLPADIVDTPSSTRKSLDAVPIDAAQPWEKLDVNGKIIRSQIRSISGLYPDSVYQSGVDRFKDDSVSKENGEAIRLASGNSGEKKIAWAMWRLTMGGANPGVITLDGNLGSADAKYFVAISDYKHGSWQWLGEFDTPHAIIPIKSRDNLSKLGNTFVLVITHNGSSVDVVGAGAHPITTSDTTPPTEVTNPKVEAIPGGLLLNWDKVEATDLAGYQISIGNKPISTLVNTTYALIPYTSGKLSITAMDTSNNASNPTEIAVPDTLVSGDIPKFNLTTDITGTQRNGKANLKANCDLSGVKYDFDLDGDGVFETLDNATGETSSVYTDSGILRPAVRAKDSSGIVRAFSAVSLIVSSNSRPVVDMTVDKSYGQAPLEVKYTAEFEDFDGKVVYIYWDVNGDGYFDTTRTNPVSPAKVSASLSSIGITNARVKVLDNEGATDLANIAVQVAADPNNQMPVIEAISSNPSIATAGLPIAFDVTASDPDGTIASYNWSFPGATPSTSTEQKPSGIVFKTSGFYTVLVKITDDKGGYSVGFIGINVNAPQVSPHPWSMKGHDAQHTGRSPYKGPDKPDYMWSKTIGSGHYSSSPAIAVDGTLYFGSEYYQIYAVNPDGTIKWSFSTEDKVDSSPAIGIDGTIYVGSHDSYLYAINPDGTLKWKYKTDRFTQSSPTIASDGTIYLGSDKLYAVNADGTLKWTNKTITSIFSTPAIGLDNVVFVCDYDGKIFAINPDGSNKWSFETENRILSSPGIGSDGTVYIGNDDGKLYAIDPNGLLKWSYQTSGAIESSPAISTDGTIYIGSNDKNLYAINHDGSLKWSFSTLNEVKCTPVIGKDGNIYLGSGCKFYSINSKGTLIWNFDTFIDYIKTSPVISQNEILYLYTFNGKLYSFGLTKDKYETDSELLPQFIKPSKSWQMQDHSIFPLGDEDWFKFYAQKDIEYCFKSNSLTNLNLSGFIYSESDEELCFDDNSNFNSQFKILWTCKETGYYYLKVIETSSSSTGSYRIDYSVSADVIWSQYGYNNSNCRKSIFIGPKTNALKWIGKNGYNISENSSPVIGADSTVYIGSYSALYAVNPDSTLKWVYYTAWEVGSAPAISNDGSIYFGDYNGYFWALNPNGSIKWFIKTNGSISSSPSIAKDGCVYFGNLEGILYAINADGTIRWTYNTYGYIMNSSPAIIDDGTIYIGSYDRNLYAINKDGSLKWKYLTSDVIGSSPTIATDGTIYIGSSDGLFYAINPNGSLKWFLNIGRADYHTSPAIGLDNTLYVANGKLWAINPDGTIKWKTTINDIVDTSPAIDANDSIYVGSSDGFIYAFNTDGTNKWSLDLGSSKYYKKITHPAIGFDGTIYFGSGDGYLYAIGPGEGK